MTYSRICVFLMLSTVVIAPTKVFVYADENSSAWHLTWSDEFDGDTIDQTKWDFVLGNGFFDYHANQWIHGWGNEELQYYSAEPHNAFVENGSLHIRAVKESLHGCGYTSAKLQTRKRDGRSLFQQRYGRFEFRAKLPRGPGLWPALWMLPQSEHYGTWPASGEIDIMEARGQDHETIIGTLHYGSRWPAHAHSGSEFVFSDETDISDFHTYAIEWEPGIIRWFVDDTQYNQQSFWWSSSKTNGPKGVFPANENDINAWPAPFDKPFYLIVNLAVGGRFAGNPDQSTTFPAEMLIDYVRVYKKKTAYKKMSPRGDGSLPFQVP